MRTFLPANQDHVERNGFGQWMSVPPLTEESIQNGILFESSIHQLFDLYLVCFNPDVRMSLWLLRLEFLDQIRVSGLDIVKASGRRIIGSRARLMRIN